MNRPKLPRPPSALSGTRPPTSQSRPPSRASSDPAAAQEKVVSSRRTASTTNRANEATSAVAPPPGPTETNIQVVVRCRDRNKREIEENSGVIITPSKDGHSITVQTSALTELNNKLYSFDKVFNGGSSQEEVFNVTVEPIVQEMLGGYNCTIFAYGQTGTGKTYTMSGDMSTHTGGMLPTSAGIIPRALARIFQILDRPDQEYSVKCSFIELYNEELRDLLSTQEDSKVRIFDDSTKKGGIIINGMEELAVKDAAHGVKILQEGSRRREVAATKCNEVSSRSHSVFTITVHIKQTRTDGEDMLRVGKLNLVDLAGSENVGRSGAENKRAREAGMINQSLLTLGRVINSLVDRSQHVPYRESKLTRLLQDSLGGRTKTCIIATLSPAKINMDETVSTLEYANRAKSIKNKPQVNQMMTKKALIKDYILEIERLKGDLNSTRTKNGVYMTEESHLELVRQSESNKLLTEEQQRKIDAMELQLQASQEQYENTLAALQIVKKDFDKTAKVLTDTELALASTRNTLQTTFVALENEKTLRAAHQQTELELNDVAASLRATLETTVTHVKSLHAKIDRKRSAEIVNHHSWTHIHQDVVKTTQHLDANLTTLSQAQVAKSNAIAERVKRFAEQQLQLFSHGLDHLEKQAQDFKGHKDGLDTRLVGAKTEMDLILDEIKMIRENVKSRLGSHLGNLNIAAQRISAEISGEMEVFQKDIYGNYDALTNMIKQIFRRTHDHVKGQAELIKQLKNDVYVASVTNKTHMRQMEEEFRQAQSADSRKNRQEEQDIMTQLQGMLETTIASRENREKQVQERMKELFDAQAAEIEAQDRQNTGTFSHWVESDGVFGRKLAKDKEEIKEKISGSWNHAKMRTESIQGSTNTIHKETVQLVDEAIQNVDSQTEALDEFVTRAKSLNKSHHEANTLATNRLLQNVRSTEGTVQKDFVNAKAELHAVEQALLRNAEEQKQTNRNSSAEMHKYASQMREAVAPEMLLDEPTETTPKKQVYIYPMTWRTTKPHDELLSKRGLTQSETNHEERSPLGAKDVNATSPMISTIPADTEEDDLTAPSVVKQSAIPAPKSRFTTEKELLKVGPELAGQENVSRPRKRKYLVGT